MEFIKHAKEICLFIMEEPIIRRDTGAEYFFFESILIFIVKFLQTCIFSNIPTLIAKRRGEDIKMFEFTNIFKFLNHHIRIF